MTIGNQRLLIRHGRLVAFVAASPRYGAQRVRYRASCPQGPPSPRCARGAGSGSRQAPGTGIPDTMIRGANASAGRSSSPVPTSPRLRVDRHDLDLGLMPVRPPQFVVARENRCGKRLRQGDVHCVIRR